jgi:superfamily II DNA or RNA helicase
VVWVIPTGGGKTRCALALIERARAKDWAAVYYFAHTAELVTQPGDQMRGLTEFAYLRAGVRGDALAGVQVCSAQTAVSRSLPPIPRADGTSHRRCIVVIDEAHRVRSATYGIIHKRLVESYEHVYLILMTATPYRRDGRGLGEVADALVEAITPRELVTAGILVDPVIYSRPNLEDESVATPGIVGDCVREWERRAGGAPTVYRCVNRAHARDVAERFRAAGHRSAHIDGTMPAAGRELLLARLAIGGSASAHPLALDVLTCGGPLMEEGFDSASSYRHILTRPEMWPTRAAGELPPPGSPTVSGVGHRSVDDEPPPYVPLACLGDAAPTTSRGAWIQRVGRVARAFTGTDVANFAARGIRSSPKSGAVVLCHSGNLERHGFLSQHEGFRLAGDREGAAVSTAYPRYRPPPLRQCTSCFACIPPGVAECPACSAPAPTPPLPEERPTVELRRADPSDPSTPPMDTDDQRADFLRAQWGHWSQARDAGRTYSVWWPAARYRGRYNSWPDFSLNSALARSFGVRLTAARRGAKMS